MSVMKLYVEGEKSKAICPFCKKIQTTTFKERDVPLSSGKGVVSDVLAAVCDKCDHVVAIPQQSVPRIKETVRLARYSLETRIPRHLLDAVALACDDLGFGPDSSPVIFRFYVQRMAGKASFRTKLAGLAASHEASGRSSARFSAKLNDESCRQLETLRHASHLNNAGVVKGVIMQMKKEILDDRVKNVRRDLQAVLQLAG